MVSVLEMGGFSSSVVIAVFPNVMGSIFLHLDLHLNANATLSSVPHRTHVMLTFLTSFTFLMQPFLMYHEYTTDISVLKLHHGKITHIPCLAQ